MGNLDLTASVQTKVRSNDRFKITSTRTEVFDQPSDTTTSSVDIQTLSQAVYAYSIAEQLNGGEVTIRFQVRLENENAPTPSAGSIVSKKGTFEAVLSQGDMSSADSLVGAMQRAITDIEKRAARP